MQLDVEKRAAAAESAEVVGAPANKIEFTPEMIAAGSDCLDRMFEHSSGEELVQEVFRAIVASDTGASCPCCGNRKTF